MDGGDAAGPVADQKHELELEEVDEGPLLTNIPSSKLPNRKVGTQGSAGRNHFSVALETVQYGTFEKLPAVLVILGFQFSFQPGAYDRVTEARVSASFEQTLNEALESPKDLNRENDPKVQKVFPGLFRGSVTKLGGARAWVFEPVLQVLDLASIKLGSVSSDYVDHRESSLWLNSEIRSSDDTSPTFNTARWQISENDAKKSGILSHFRGAVVVTLPVDLPHPVALTVKVNASAWKFSLKKLRSKGDAPIFLDRRTKEGTSFGSPGKDFADVDFDWKPVIDHVFPTEQADIHALSI